MRRVEEPIKFKMIFMYSFLQIPHIFAIIILNYAAFLLYLEGMKNNEQLLIALSLLSISIAATWAIAILMKLMIDAQTTANFNSK